MISRYICFTGSLISTITNRVKANGRSRVASSNCISLPRRQHITMNHLSGQFITTWSLDCLLQLLWLSVYHQKWLVHRWENQAKVEDCLRSDKVVIQQKRKLMINVRTEENRYPQFLGHTQLILCISLLGLHRVCTSRKSSGPSRNWTILTFSCYWSVVAAIVCMQW